MSVDQQEREEALDASRSFIVEAPAGSGKTGLLVQRFLKLLGGVERPESVVAMTFTRKAAAEMKSRVLKALVAAEEPIPAHAAEFERATIALAAEVSKQDKAKGWNLLQDPSRLQIQTIDSLCALLTRQMPVLSEFGGFGQVVEEASELYLSAAREMLTNLAEGDERARAIFGRMVLHFDNDISKLEGLVVKMLSKRDQWEHLDSRCGDQLVQDCCALLQRAEGTLRLVFQRAGKVDFTEIAKAARRALGKPEQPSDLLYSLDYRLQHLLVDEFQDTSRSQYELVKALTEQWSLGDDHTLFLVGDPMQSIYRFREADVSLFLRCWNEERIGAVRLDRLRLQTNFRSTANILQWVEKHVGPLMPEDDPASGAVKFRESVSGRNVNGAMPRVVAHIEDKGSDEAAEIISIIQANAESEVAILVRSRTQTTHILPALRKAGIKYEAIDIDSLQNQQHIIDVLSITRALTNLGDRVSWLACLRAPWCGLTLADLSVLAEGRREQTIFDLLSDAELIARLSIDGRWRAVRAQEILASAVSQVGRMPLRQLVERTWRELGGLAAIAEENQREDIETLFRLIEESDDGGFIRDFSLLNKRLEFLYAKPSASGAKVSVMTIFAAKGLEFDVVILPQIAKKGRSDEGELLIWMERDDKFLVAALPQTGEEDLAYKEIQEVNKQKEEQEAKRVFYVACTRAKNELHLLGNAERKKDGNCRTPSSGTFLRMIWESVQDEFEGKLRRTFSVPPNGGAVVANRSMLRRLAREWRAPVIASPIEAPLPVRHAVASQRQVSYRWVGDTSRHAGTIVHELLKQIAADGLERWSDSRVFKLHNYVGDELVRLGVPAEEVPAAAKQVLKAVITTISSEKGRWILSPHEQERSEWAIAGRVGESLVSGTVDRAFLDDGRFWIIDFKNSEHSGSQVEKFLANEMERYQPQLEQYAAVVSRLVNAPVSLGLYFPLLDAWRAWQFAEAAMAVS